MTAIVLLFVVALVVALRAAFVRISAQGAIDHYYWIQAGRVFRRAGWRPRLPIIIPDKYLLEDDRQAYPPVFGWLLGRLPERWLVHRNIIWLAQAADAAALALVLAFALAGGASAVATIVIVAVYGLAPVLVAYNTQLNSRAFGNVFLIATLFAQVSAASVPATDPYGLMLYAVAIATATGVVLTHKMTTQLMIALWPFWSLALASWRIALCTPLALLLAALVTGREFATLQWSVHADIVKYYLRNRHVQGAHAFLHSPIYGDPSRIADAAFHKPGWRGAISHAILVFSYCPAAWLAPLTLAWDAWPPLWIVTWSLGACAVALLTLYVPWLRCFGGGHFYMFNAVAPAALWWSMLVSGGETRTLALFALAMAATLGSLALGYRRRARFRYVRDADFQAVIEYLAAQPAQRVAVFPLTAAEELAYRTPHAVLWGGHNYGFRRLDPVLPLMRARVSDVARANGCALLLLDTVYWPGAEAAVEDELAGAEVRTFGRWCLLHVPVEHPVAAAPPQLAAVAS